PQDASVSGTSEPPSYAENAFWFFQMVFVATAASVVSGCLAERIRLWPFLIFVAVMSALIYPIVGSWTWGGGWLSALGFSDFAGSTIVHSVGGWAALAGAIVLGPRRGRFREDGLSLTMPYASAPQIAIGVLILWFGWFGFNGGSQLSFSSIEDAIAVAGIFANTNAAAAGGVLAALIASQLIRGRPDILLTMNGALAGLVAITAEPSAPSIGMSALIGAGGGLVMIGGVKLLELWKIDDVVGAIPVHLAAGVYGTLAAALTNTEANFFIQLLGVLVIGAFVFGVSFVSWAALNAVMGLRLDRVAEDIGADMSEVGTRAYHFDLTGGPIDTFIQKEAA
ncbi:MAG: ammonium transporter, partial [Amphiplicatus sp.]